MNNIFAIASRELRSLLLSPLAWSILAVVEFLLAYLFLSHIDYYRLLQPRIGAIPGAPGVTDMVVAPVFGNAGIIMLVSTPLLTMRLIAEERRNKTLTLLLTAPVSISEIVIGKFFGVMMFLAIMEAIILLMPLALLLGTQVDMGKLLACAIALGLLLSSFTAIGLYMSTLTSHPLIAALNSFGLLMLLWILDWATHSSGDTSELFQYLSLLKHFREMLLGVLSSADIAYYLLVTVMFLLLSIRRLQFDRQNN